MKKCGLYLRVSTDQQAEVKEGSLKSQQIRLEALAKSKSTELEEWKAVRVYREEGYSGKNLNRPQMQLLINDILNKKINTVICTKIDRITRSLLDFYYLYQIFQKHNVDFICLDDNVDTSTTMGRMALKMVLIFAELERELISERTRNCLMTRSLSGLWNKGPILGYDIDINNPGFLKVNKEEKELVNRVFKTYNELKSIPKTCDALNNTGLHTKSYPTRDGAVHEGKKFHNHTVSTILTNKLYLGMIEINKNNKSKDQSLLPVDRQYKTVKGKHEPIVENDLFQSIQNIIAAHRRERRKPENSVHKHFYLLDGLLYCGLCGFPMKKVWGNGHGGAYFYYKCICQKKYINAGQMETEVISEVRKHISEDYYHNTSQSNIISKGSSLSKKELGEFIRRLILSKNSHQRYLLHKIVKKITYKNNNIEIEIY